MKTAEGAGSSEGPSQTVVQGLVDGPSPDGSLARSGCGRPVAGGLFVGGGVGRDGGFSSGCSVRDLKKEFSGGEPDQTMAVEHEAVVARVKDALKEVDYMPSCAGHIGSKAEVQSLKAMPENLGWLLPLKLSLDEDLTMMECLRGPVSHSSFL